MHLKQEFLLVRMILVIPTNKGQLIDDTKKLIADYENQYSEGLITRGEKYNKVVDAWSKCTDKVAGEMMRGISATESTPDGMKINSVFMMADSGARGSAAQMKQLSRNERTYCKTFR